jgi:hypothetical protein
MFFQQNTDTKVTMIRLNPVQDDDDCVDRGLFLVDNDLCNKLTQFFFRKILLTDATTEDGEDEVATYFKVKKQWDELLDQWNEEEKVVIDFKWYYKLLFLVKLASEVDHI